MRRASALALLALGAALSAAAADAPLRITPYPARLPEGPGRAIAERACLVCHSAQLIAQQHKDQAAWEKTIATMEKWGAPLTPAQHDSLRSYLVKKLGPSGAAPGRPAPHG
jgi:cytochrome c5